MANTQGLSDDALESLLSSTNMSERSNALQRRLDMPIGERPAATVVRKKSSRATAISVPQQATMYDASAASPETDAVIGENNIDSEAAVAAEHKPPVLGRVMERLPGRQTISSGDDISDRPTKTKAVSRFAAQQRQLTAPSGQGFPSLDRPLGTFVIKSKQAAKSETNAAVVSAAATSRNTPLTARSAATSGTSSIESLRMNSAKDAQAMLEGLSTLEILEKQQELKSSLSTDMVAFLKNRAAKQTADAAAARTAAKLQTLTIGDGGIGDQNEKARLAEVLSSIRTYEELDDAVAAAESMDDAGSLDASANPKDEFDLACDLLRSSVPRQNLWAVRVIVEKLKDDWDSGRLCSLAADGRTVAWPYPTLLPVSLRCLLDSPLISRPNGHMLCTMVLQSLYFLLQLRAHPVHAVDVTGTRQSTSDNYQLYYMNDAVPTPRVSTCYSSAPTTSLFMGEGSQPVAYSTASTSKSAETDADSFQRDPMWTLLSRMRILPRLAHLLSGTLPYEMPKEALLAINGILAMLAQRSPGAASAIVQHETLLPSIIRQTLESDEDDNVPRIVSTLGISSIILLCTLARQSRVAAEGLDVESTILRLLASEPSNEAEHLLQKWTLVLWRTLLRYGLCLLPLQAILTLAAPSITLGGGRFSLAAEYFSALTCVCDVARVVNQSKNSRKVAAEIVDGLSFAGVWMNSFKHQALHHLCKLPEDLANPTSHIRLQSSCVRFLDAYITISSHDFTETDGELKVEVFSLVEENVLCDSIESLLASDMFTKAIDTFFLSFGQVTAENLAYEATCSALVHSVCILVRFLVNLCSKADRTAATAVHVVQLVQLIGDHMHRHAIKASNFILLERSAIDLPRIGWQNQTLSVIIAVLACRYVESSLDMRDCAQALVGRLQFGEESLAAALLSQDNLFLPEEASSLVMLSSPVSSLLVRQLCRSRNQLDHSFKLHGGVGIDPSSLGALELQSLLSEAEGSHAASEQLLPMGNLWLWQILSGSVSSDEGGDTEAVQILICTLELILDREVNGALASTLDTGAKLYFVVNICLHPETIWNNATIQSAAGKLVDIYSHCDDLGETFINACRSHSALRQSVASGGGDSDPTETELKKLIDPQSNDTYRAIEEFVTDFCEIFTESGGEGSLVARCMRVFLLPSFSTKIRCLVIRRLAGLLHLLNVEGDDTRDLLTVYIRVGIPNVDASSKDSPELLDTLASVVLKDNESRHDLGFVSQLAIGLLARSLALAVWNGTGFAVTKDRLCQLNTRSLSQILQVTARFLASAGTSQDLVDACLNLPKADVITLPGHIFRGNLLDWDATHAFLCSLKQ